MSGVLFRSRALFRRRGAAWIGLAAVLGITGGVCMAFGQGARRTDVAYNDFVRAQQAADVVIAGQNGYGFVGSVDPDLVEHLPDVIRSAPAFGAIPFSGTTDDGRTIGVSDLLPVASVDGRLGTSVERFKMLQGRPATPGRIDEATASRELARRMNLHVGNTLRLRFYDSHTFTQVAAHFLQQWPARLRAESGTPENASDPADGPTVRVRIVGIEASPLEFPPLINDLAPVLHLTPAFAHRYDAGIVGSRFSYVRLKRSTELRAFQLEIERLARGRPVSFISTLDNQRAKVQRSLRVEALVLAIVAGLLALAGGVAVAQALNRQATSEAADDHVLRALGMRRAELRAITLLRSAVIALVAVVVALPVAWFASSFVLLSIGRLATVHPGRHLDGSTVLAGSVAILLFGLGFGALAARRAGADPDARDAPSARSRAGDLVQRAGLPMSAALGVRFALRRRDRSASASVMLLGASLGVATITLAGTFTALLHRDLAEPHRHGWNWDFKLGAPALPDIASVLLPPLRADSRITDLSVGTVTQIDISTTRIDVFAIDVVRGAALPTLTAGHAPLGPNEMVFGNRSLRAAHASIGDTVRARIGSNSATFRVVGSAIFPEFGDSGQLGTGAWTTVAGLRRIAPDAAPQNTFLIRLTAPARAAGVEQQIVRAVAPLPVRDSGRPEDLVNLSRGDGLLFALTALLAALALAVLVHALLTSVRHDRADHAVLRALGRTRAQTRLSVTFQALTLCAGMFAVGVPLGLLAARALWAAYARRIGVTADTFVPFARVGLILAGSVFVALVAAVVTAWLSARSDVASALRAED